MNLPFLKSAICKTFTRKQSLYKQKWSTECHKNTLNISMLLKLACQPASTRSPSHLCLRCRLTVQAYSRHLIRPLSRWLIELTSQRWLHVAATGGTLAICSTLFFCFMNSAGGKLHIVSFNYGYYLNKWGYFFTYVVCLLVTSITQKLLNRFPKNLDEGWVSFYNRPWYPLVWIGIKGTHPGWWGSYWWLKI